VTPGELRDAALNLCNVLAFEDAQVELKRWVNAAADALAEMPTLRARRRELGERLLSKHAADKLRGAVGCAWDEDQIDEAEVRELEAALERATVKPADCDHRDYVQPLPRCPRCGSRDGA